MSSITKILRGSAAPHEHFVKPTLVPKLRFPEFEGAGEWESISLGGVARLRNGYAFKSAEYVDEGPYKIITIANVQQGGLTIESTKRMAALPSDIQQHQVLRLGDILISMTGNVGRVCRVTAEGLLLNQRVGKLVPEKIDAAFLYQLLQRDEFRNTMQLKAAGGAQGNLSGGDITEYAFTVPPTLPEQQRIASCLSSLDELITAQAQKVEALKTHKKGLMQQLFPREGETQPRLRFPEFEGAWEEQALGEVATFHKGKGISKADISINGQTPCIRYGELYTVYGEVIDNVQSRTDFPVADLFLSHSNDVIIPASGETKLDIAKAACVIHDDVALGGDLNVIRTSHRGIFLSYYLNGPKRYDIAKVAQGDTVAHLYPSQLKKLVIALPSESEQQRIASCLSRLDELITNESNKLETYKTHKKGLMQGLFPKVEEGA